MLYLIVFTIFSVCYKRSKYFMEYLLCPYLPKHSTCISCFNSLLILLLSSLSRWVKTEPGGWLASWSSPCHLPAVQPWVRCVTILPQFPHLKKHMQRILIPTSNGGRQEVSLIAMKYWAEYMIPGQPYINFIMWNWSGHLGSSLTNIFLVVSPALDTASVCCEKWTNAYDN